MRFAHSGSLYANKALRESGARGGHATREHHATTPFANIHITDRISHQATTEAVFRMLLAGSIPPRRATHIIRVLALAQRSL